MPARRPSGSLRLSFRLGPFRSPTARAWQAAYDGLVERLTDAAVPIYGVLEADLASGDLGSARWYNQFAEHAAAVVNRYADRIPTFEVAPGPNLPDANGKPRLSPAAFARTLALVYEQVKGEGHQRQTMLVAGAIALAHDGPAYLTQTLTFGAGSTAWDTVRQATRASVPFDALACWPGLAETPGAHLPDALLTQMDRFLAVIIGSTSASGKPIYISGLTWVALPTTQPTDAAIEQALTHIGAQRPGVRLAARDTALAGPVGPGEDASAVVGAFAIFSPTPPRVVDIAALGKVPIVDGFDYPVGPRGQPDPPPGYASAAGLAGEAYYRQFRAWHTGDDWNGPGPGDADLGLPVYAAAHGVVVVSDYFTPAWGHIILVQHTLPNGGKLWTQYAHLRERLVQPGQVVERGQAIGSIGKGANDLWLAHLHFEIRQCDLPAANWQPFVSDRQRVLDCYFDTIQFTQKHRPHQSVADGIIVDSEPGDQPTGGFVRSTTPHWLSSFYGWNGTSLYTYGSKTETEWGEWRPRLAKPGRYEVQAWIPSFHATTRNARYTITHAQGVTEVNMDQSRHFDEWVSLGVYQFATQGAVVRLSDLSGETDEARFEVCFDALRWLAQP